MAGRAERRRFASPAEIELWRAALRDVRPLHGRKPAQGEAPPPAPQPPLAAGHRPGASPAPTTPGARGGDGAPPLPGPGASHTDHVSPIPHGLDKRTAERLRRGQLAIEARLDLHGMTQDEAHGALFSFLARSEAQGLRCLLVITGKGIRRTDGHDFRGEAIGVLKHAVPRWLGEAGQRRRILAIAPAQPKHGGSGALYVLLRRQRP